MQFFMYFYGGQLQQLYTANFLYVFNPFKMGVKFRFSHFDGWICFLPPKSTGPWPDFRKVGKSLDIGNGKQRFFFSA